MQISNLIKKKRELIVVLFFIAIFLIINMSRISVSSYFPGAESTIFVNDFQEYKAFAYEGTNIFYEAIIEISFLVGENVSIFLVIFISSLVSIILFNKISNLVLKKEAERLIAGILFVLTSIFLLSVSAFSYLPLVIMLILWTIYLSFVKQKMVFIPLILSIFININLFILNFIITLVMYIFLYRIFYLKKFKDEIHKKIVVKKFFIYNILLPAIALILTSIYSNLVTKDLLLTNINYSNNLLSSNVYTISIVYVLLGFFALFSEIKDNRILIITIFLLLLSFLNIYAGIVFMIWVCMIAAIGLYRIIKRKWFVKELRTPVIFLLVLLLLFSSISFTDTIISSGPSDELVEDTNIMYKYKEKNFDDGNVFCNLRDCNIVSAYSNNSVFYSIKQYENEEDHMKMLNLTSSMFGNSNLGVMQNFFAKNNISTVFISEKTLNEEWSSVDEGMLLLLTKSRRFVMLDNTEESRIFYYMESINASEEE